MDSPSGDPNRVRRIGALRGISGSPRRIGASRLYEDDRCPSLLHLSLHRWFTPLLHSHEGLSRAAAAPMTDRRREFKDGGPQTAPDFQRFAEPIGWGAAALIPVGSASFCAKKRQRPVPHDKPLPRNRRALDPVGPACGGFLDPHTAQGTPERITMRLADRGGFSCAGRARRRAPETASRTRPTCSRAPSA
jgi:hypothetical protein